MVGTLEALLQEVPVPAAEKPDSTPPNLAAARACVDWMILAILHLNRSIGFEAQASIWVRDLVLSSASQAAVFWRHGWSDEARVSLLHSWIDQSLVFETSWKHLYELRNRLIHDQFSPAAIRLQGSDLDREFLLVFSVAVAEKLSADQAESQARQAIRQLLARMELSVADLGRLLGVSADVVDQWESAQVMMPADARAIVTRANSALSRLLAIFRPERLPQVIRQKVALFRGESAYDWILQGRIQEVADLYEVAFAYQG